MRGKGLLAMIILNILLIVILVFYIVGHKEVSVVSVSSGSQLLLQSQVSAVAKESTHFVVQIVAEDTSMYYQDGKFDKDSSQSKKTIIHKGSGILGSQDGYVITSNHVVDNPDLHYRIITSEGISYSVKKIRKDELVDIAVLLLDAPQKFQSVASFSDSPSVEVGQFVLAVGNPLSEYPNTVSFGIISGKGRKIDIENAQNPYYAGLYQTDAALNPGNSGGPLINLSGQVLGLITAISRGGNNIGFALPLNKKFIDTTLSLISQYGQLSRPYLGVAYTDTETGARIDTLFMGSSLEGFLQVGDVVTALDKSSLSLDMPLLYHLYMHKPGETVLFTVERGTQILNFPIVLGQKSS